ncbi:unnamed protein product, partial [Symbiodinium sp. CCMP2456]
VGDDSQDPYEDNDNEALDDYELAIRLGACQGKPMPVDISEMETQDPLAVAAAQKSKLPAQVEVGLTRKEQRACHEKPKQKNKGSPAKKVEIPAQEEQEPSPTQQKKKPKKADASQSQPTNRLPKKQPIEEPVATPQASKKGKHQEISELKPDARGKRARKATAEEKPSNSRDQKAAAKDKPATADDEPKEKQTFARRLYPKKEYSIAKWCGLRKTYESHVGPRLRRPSKFEDHFWSFFTKWHAETDFSQANADFFACRALEIVAEYLQEAELRTELVLSLIVAMSLRRGQSVFARFGPQVFILIVLMTSFLDGVELEGHYDVIEFFSGLIDSLGHLLLQLGEAQRWNLPEEFPNPHGSVLLIAMTICASGLFLCQGMYRVAMWMGNFKAPTPKRQYTPRFAAHILKLRPLLKVPVASGELRGIIASMVQDDSWEDANLSDVFWGLQLLEKQNSMDLAHVHSVVDPELAAMQAELNELQEREAQPTPQLASQSHGFGIDDTLPEHTYQSQMTQDAQRFPQSTTEWKEFNAARRAAGMPATLPSPAPAVTGSGPEPNSEGSNPDTHESGSKGPTAPKANPNGGPAAPEQSAELELYVAEPAPPPLPDQPTEGAIYKRLYRLAKAREDGSFLIPQAIRNDWLDKEKRPAVVHLFERCAWDVRKFTVKVRKLYEKIDEIEMEEDYEFLTEDCMRELGWERIAGVKEHCSKIPGFTRKRLYDNKIMYWTTLSVKGKKKTTKRTAIQKMLDTEEDAPEDGNLEGPMEFDFEGGSSVLLIGFEVLGLRDSGFVRAGVLKVAKVFCYTKDGAHNIDRFGFGLGRVSGFQS